MPKFLARKRFPEMDLLEALIEELGDWARVEIIKQVSYEERSFPLYVVQVGSTDPKAPALGFFGGVHGLEKIGAEVVLSHLSTVASLIKWDKSFQQRLESSRMVFMPIVNPVGIVLRRRSNGQGVDLMRNSPVEAEGPLSAARLYQGQSISPQLPWFRGYGELEPEAQALCEVVRRWLFPSQLAMAIDVHSGFGSRDRMWFPYAYSRRPCPHIGQIHALKGLFDHSYPHHFYAIEPVSRQYTIHGDLWDYLYLEHQQQVQEETGGKVQRGFIPWTLEMGSWMWLRKNPSQLFSRFGAFDPVKPHRRERILRRHLNLFDFVQRSLLAPESWFYLAEEDLARERAAALELWYA